MIVVVRFIDSYFMSYQEHTLIQTHTNSLNKATTLHVAVYGESQQQQAFARNIVTRLFFVCYLLLENVIKWIIRWILWPLWNYMFPLTVRASNRYLHIFIPLAQP